MATSALPYVPYQCVCVFLNSGSIQRMSKFSPMCHNYTALSFTYLQYEMETWIDYFSKQYDFSLEVSHLAVNLTKTQPSFGNQWLMVQLPRTQNTHQCISWCRKGSYNPSVVPGHERDLPNTNYSASPLTYTQVWYHCWKYLSVKCCP